MASAAAFSPYHFHRIFKTITQETLLQYITRRRVEKAASLLLHSDQQIQEIAFSCGFRDPTNFTRTFKKFYEINPTDFRKQHPNTFSKIRQLHSKNGQSYPDYDQYICMYTNLQIFTRMTATIEIKEIPLITAAGIMHTGVTGIEDAFEKLLKWSNPKNLLDHADAKMGRLYYDSFKITAPDKVRMHIFLKTEESFETFGEIEKIVVHPGKCIVGSFEVAPYEFEKSWTGLFIWMNENGYQKSEAHPFEIYHNDFRKHPEGKCLVDLCIPVQ